MSNYLMISYPLLMLILMVGDNYDRKNNSSFFKYADGIILMAPLALPIVLFISYMLAVETQQYEGEDI